LPAGSTSPEHRFGSLSGTSPDAHHAPRAPCPSGCFPLTSQVTWKGITLSHRSYGLRRQLPPTHFGLGLAPWVLAGCCQPLLEDGPSRRYLRKSFPRCLDPYPGGTLWCIRPFLPIGHQPSPPIYRVGSHTNRRATSLRGFISGLQSFRHVQAPGFAHHPGRSYRSLDIKTGQP
jgi:hypothetical protein